MTGEMKLDTEQAIEQARREYGALLAGIGDAARRVLSIRRLLKSANAGLEVLDVAGKISAEQINLDLTARYEQSLADSQQEWSTMALRPGKPSGRTSSKRR